MSPADAIRIRHMIDAAGAAIQFAKGRSRADLDADRMLRFALVRAVEIVGEASSKVSAAGRDERPEVPWSAIVGMRNRLVHACFEVDPDILWATVTEPMPALLRQLEAGGPTESS